MQVYKKDYVINGQPLYSRLQTNRPCLVSQFRWSIHFVKMPCQQRFFIDSSGKSLSSSFLQRSIILSIPNIVKHYLHVCLSVSAPVVWLRCRRNNIFSLLVCLCPGGGWAGAGAGATIQHSSVFCVTSSPACFIISGIRPGRATAEDTKLRETRACLLGKPICLMPVCRILN